MLLASFLLQAAQRPPRSAALHLGRCRNPQQRQTISQRATRGPVNARRAVRVGSGEVSTGQA